MNPSFSELKKNLKKDFSRMKEIKIAILADSASQLFVQALKGHGYLVGIEFNILEAEYDQIFQEVANETSALYAFEPKFVLVFQSSRKLQEKFYKLSPAGKISFANEHSSFVQEITEKITRRLNCNIIYLNFNEINDSVFGNFANKSPFSFLCQLRKVNKMLMDLSQRHISLSICDVSALQNQFGREFMTSDRLYVNTDNVFSLDALPVIVSNITDIILAFTGTFKKCIILDLDNTIWGGIIGDDGMENIEIGNLGIGKAFSLFQKWIKQLKERGIILAVCSKNSVHIAKEPFEKHPDMELRLDDIAVFVANWENKVSNIHYIRSVLNISFDSMLFLDDNPAEREMVRTNIPGLMVPELPEDPAEFVSFLATFNLFETMSITEEDSKRTRLYQEEAGRSSLMHSMVDEVVFLQNLEMKAEVKLMNTYTLPRVAQLIQRSNQFNLRTVRYTEEELKETATNKNKLVLTVKLADKFGDYGLISVLILEIQNEGELFIDTWIMSCRVLKRDVEFLALNEMAALAIKHDCHTIIGEYLPTIKNELVKDHFRKLGFTFKDGYWYLHLKEYLPKKICISKL